MQSKAVISRCCIGVVALLCLLSNKLGAQEMEARSVPDHLDGGSFYAKLQGFTIDHQGEMVVQAKAFCKQNIKELKQLGTDLVLRHKIRSSAGWHLSFQPTYQGIPVYGTEVKINLSLSGRVMNISSNYPSLQPPSSDVASYQGIDEESNAVVWIDDKGTPKIATRFIVEEAGMAREVVELNGVELINRSMSREMGKRDTLVDVKVFYPDPLTSAKVTYGPPYVDADDADVPELNAERVWKKVMASVEKNNGRDSFWLENSDIKIVEVMKPEADSTYEETYSFDGKFDFLRSQHHFEAANAFYHVSAFKEYLREDLGNSEMLDYQILVDPYASKEDNSKFNVSPGDTAGKGWLWFGIGVIDDAEDADVILHELGHAMSYYASRNAGLGNERQAIEEGLCDYFACSYSRSISEHLWSAFPTWDGNDPTEFWGRSCKIDAKYPEGRSVGPHIFGQLWSSAIMRIQESVGREVADKLMIASLYDYSVTTSFKEAAQIFIQKDELLYERAHYQEIEEAFVYYNFMEPSSLDQNGTTKDQVIIDSESFANRSILNLRFERAAATSISLHSSDGKLVFNDQGNITGSYQQQLTGINPGVYILSIKTGDRLVKRKLVSVASY